jgi:hypothetical protein
MNRNRFVKLFAASGLALTADFLPAFPNIFIRSDVNANPGDELSADVVICGGGLGGCAAALSALRNDLTVIITEETSWFGGQMTQQGVPPDEHQWIETKGATRQYREFRNSIREYYRKNYPVTEAAKADQYLNPGEGSVSRLCFEPRVAVAVLMDMLTPFIYSGKLKLLTGYKVVEADYSGDRITAVKATDTLKDESKVLTGSYFIDATELGDLLPLTKTEFVTGTESKSETGELHAPETGNPESNQSFTFCFAIDHVPGEDHTIEKPQDYEFWRNYKPDLKPGWPGKLLDFAYSNPSTLEPKSLAFDPTGADTSPLLNLWTYRRIINKNNFRPGTFKSDITLVNWPQNDFMEGNLIGADSGKFKKITDNARQLSLSLLYWLQTEAPRGNSAGWPGLRLRKDIMGTDDGLAKYPYIREARRIKAMFTVLEEHVGRENRSLVTGKDIISAEDFHDSVGIGYYHIDLHPTCAGNNYIDFDSLPFQIPLGALIPRRMENLIPASKNIGTTHITNGCYRLHPVEWSIGEAAGSLVAFAMKKKTVPKAVLQRNDLLSEFQDLIRKQGIETHWT